jgi:phosphohistidine phosphatase
MADPVTIYLVRHAVAAERGPDYPDDTRRPLTPKGIERFREGVAGLVAAGVEIDEILTSPYVRARQTAELLAEGFARRPKVTNMHALAVEGSPVEVIDTLARYARRQRLALVGHAPAIGLLAARLTGHRRAFEFRKGAIACIEVDALPPTGPGILQWLLPLRLLRRMAP